MKYIKTYEFMDDNISAEMTHEKIRECSQILQKEMGIYERDINL